YGIMLLLMLATLVYAAATRVPMALDVQRDRNQLFRETAEGWVENTYTLKLSNRTQQPQQYHVRVEGLDHAVWRGADEVWVPAGEIVNLPISLALDPYLLPGSIHPLRFVAGNQEAEVGADSQFFSAGR
ncbi:MAG: FixG Ig-like domain-containing protein, partial [Oceanisphaera sp.]|nr:FixG Ig-like domain-containing protein [Oceanisphaera sp.]